MGLISVTPVAEFYPQIFTMTYHRDLEVHSYKLIFKTWDFDPLENENIAYKWGLEAFSVLSKKIHYVFQTGFGFRKIHNGIGLDRTVQMSYVLIRLLPN